ncbi:MAG: sulfatase-like hydrolase/transferase, partial [Gemmatimonadetes bacterium]|nr:sulfatase-like hydrolase/transferase [Gemmatimonadota bacterium]
MNEEYSVSETKRLVSRTITLSCMLCALLSCAPDNASPPNILLISMDTVRSDHCSVYGYHADTTPNLQRVAEGGACFDLAYSPTSTTGPTHASLFTSLYPMQHGVIKNGLNLDDRFTTLAERLREKGYQTAAIISSFVLDSKFGYGQGFDFYDDDLDWESSKTQRRSWEGHEVEHGFDRPG